MTILHTVIITFANGSKDEHPFEYYSAARDFYRNGISYSGGRVKRVETRDHYGNVRAIWDSSWDDQSKYAGMK